MVGIKQILEKYYRAEKDKTFPFAEWHRRDVYEKLIKDFLILLGYNPDQISYYDEKGYSDLPEIDQAKLTKQFIPLDRNLYKKAANL